jgi:hypothetical protein
MNNVLAELVLKISSEKDAGKKLALIQDLKDALDAEQERVKGQAAKACG